MANHTQRREVDKGVHHRSQQERNAFTGFNGVSPETIDETGLYMYGHSLGADYSLELTEGLELTTQVGLHADNWTEIALIPLFQVNAAGTRLLYDENGLPLLDPVR